MPFRLAQIFRVI
jgi:hypothetical protein